MKVLKFGGTSVGTPARIEHVGKLICKHEACVTVLSAMSGTTNTLVEIAQYLSLGNLPGAQETLNSLESKYTAVCAELLGDAPTREAAEQAIHESMAHIRLFFSSPAPDNATKEIVAQGELMSTALMYNHLRAKGIKVAMLPALDIMRTLPNGEPDSDHIKECLGRYMEQNKDAQVYLTQGFICRDSQGRVDNLTRGGSDYTASLIGAAINAEEIQIWTDIDGMHNNDPRFVKGTRPVRKLHFEEAAELAYFGAKILHPTCVLPAKLANIPVRLLNTLDPGAEGTLICNCEPDGKIKAVAAKDNITAIKIKSGRMLLAYGFLHKVFETFENHRTGIDMMATSEVGVSVTIDDTARLADIVDDLKHFGTVTVESDMVIICVVGDLQWHNCGLQSKVLEALAGIPVRMVSYGGSNYNISVLVRQCDKIKALEALSQTLFPV